MLRRVTLLTALILGAWAAPAGAATLFSTLDQPNNVQDINSVSADGDADYVAQSFVPSVSGTVRTVSLYAQANSGETSALRVLLMADQNGQPGQLLGSALTTVGDLTGASPTCVVLNSFGNTNVTAGVRYWIAVANENEPRRTVNWLYSRQEAKDVLETRNNGALWTKKSGGKTLSLRLDDGTSCGPDIVTNPVAGGQVADMYAKPGGSGFQTVTVHNSGNQTLTLTGATFTGPNAGSFRLLQGQPGTVTGNPYPFPRTVGATPQAVEILYVACDGAPPEGTRTATLTLFSNDPDEGSVSFPVSCLIDATPPTVEYTVTPNGREGWFATRPAPFTARGVDPASGNRVKLFECTDSVPPATFTWPNGSVASFSLNADGVHAIGCAATDVANNKSAPFPVTIKVDGTPPETTKTGGPPENANQTAASFAFTVADATSGTREIECKLDTGAWEACASPALRSSLADGVHTFQARVRDVAGTWDPTPATWSWRVDTVAPDTTLGGGPANPTTAATAAFTAGGSDPGGSGVERYECSLDGAPFGPCPAAIALSDIGEGGHTLQARAVDKAGNADPTPAERSWAVDRTAPAAVLTQKPAVLTAATGATFAFEAGDAGPAAPAGFECRLDGGAWAPCTSPASVGPLEGERDHTFEVRAKDVLGNVQAAPTAHTWTISQKPRAVDDTAATTRDAPVDVAVLANDLEPTGAALTVSGFSATSAQGGTVALVDGALRYTPPAGFTGSDSFTYEVTGGAGLPSAPATVTVTVDRPVTPAATPPGAAPDLAAPKVTRVRVAGRMLRFDLDEAATVTVKLRRKGAKRAVTLRITGAAGANAKRLPKKLKGGRYAVTVIAVDGAGNAAAPLKARGKLARPQRPR